MPGRPADGAFKRKARRQRRAGAEHRSISPAPCGKPGLPLGPGAVLDALAAVEAAGIGDRDDFYTTLHAVFVKKHEHSLLFDQAFRIFWTPKGLLEKLIAMMSPRPTRPSATAETGGSRGEPRRRRSVQVAAGGRPRRRRRSISTRVSRCRRRKFCDRRISRK